jgi:UDP-N-acetyl-D-galactosamine dehydrogenase
VGVLGLTFKENVPDTRNSRVPDILNELREFGIQALAHDPLADPGEFQHEYGIATNKLSDFKGLDALVLAVPHEQYLARPEKLFAMLRSGGILIDIKSAIDPNSVPGNLRYWSL